MSTQYEYTLKADDERLILKKIIPTLYNYNVYDIQYYFTDSGGYDVYDAYVMGFNKDTHSCVRRHLIEIKVRDTHYPDLLLEKEKLENLKKKASESDATVIYISTTPKGSYIFNLTQLESSIQWNKEEHWKSTTDKSKGKKYKWVTYLPITSAKYLPIKQTDLDGFKKEEQQSHQLKKTVVKQRQRICLWEQIMKGS